MSDQPTYAQRMIQAQANEIVERATKSATRVTFGDWAWGTAASRLVLAEALTCLLEDAAFYGEESVSVYRLKRLRDQFNPAETRGEVSP